MAKKFLTDIKIAAGVYDSSGDIGNSGQVLSSTGSGVNWINTTTSASVIYQDGFTGNGSTTAFTLANSLDNENKTQVYIDGVYQHKDNYSLSGTTLTFSTAPPNSSDIEVISFSSVTAADDILYDNDFSSAGLMTTNGSGVYSITTNNSSNWNTAYTYSQVGHLPLAGGAITGAITTNSTFDGRDVSVDGTKLDGIEANATADQTNAEIRAAVEAATDSNVFTDADHTKLNAIEASADVTDTVNVTAAGALMDSELTDLAGIKAVTISDLATETYVDTAVSDLVDSSPATLNTLNELAAALGDDPNFATTTANSIGTKMPLAGGTFTGDISIPDKLIHSGDTNTYLSFSGADNIKLVAGGKNVLHAHDNGNLYLYGNNGTALTLDGSQNATFAGDIIGVGASFIGAATSGVPLVTIENNSGSTATSYGLLVIGGGNSSNGRTFEVRDASGNTDLIVKGNGNVGIGTTSPAEKLEVSGSVKIGNLKIQNADGGRIGFNRNTATGAIYNSNYAAFQINGAYSGADYLEIQNYNSSGVFAGSAVLKNGNFGIGTTSPSYKLEVNGGTALVGGGFYVSTDQSISTNFAYTFRDAVGINNPNSISATANTGYTMCVGRSHNSGSGVSGSISAVGTIRASAFTTGINTTAGVGASNGDVNAAEIGPGYLNLSRDDTAASQQIRFEKNGALHSYIETTTSGLNIGNANVYLAKSTNQGQLFFGTADNQYEIFGGGTWGYMGYNTSGYHRFFGSGTERMRITNAGKVGIGTTSPAYKLHIEDANAAIVYVKSTTNNQNASIWFNSNSGGTQADRWEIGTNISAGTDLEFFDRLNSVSRMVIQNDGKVGIGTISPSAQLHLYNAAASGTPMLQVMSHATAAGSFTGNYMAEFCHAFSGVNHGMLIKNNEASDGRNTLDVADANGVFATFVNGKVGIGTTSPSAKLQVQQDQTAESNVIFMNNSTGANAAIRLSLNVGNPAGDDPKISFNVGDGGLDWTMGVDNSDSDKFKISGGTDSHNPNLGTNDRLVIDASGKVGIGTTSPRAKLEVDGELIAKDIKHSNFAVASLNTTGYTIATVTGSGNGASAVVEFTGIGGTNGVVDVVYSCTNQSGNWYATARSRQTAVKVDVVVTGNGTTTLSFVFKSLSGTQGYTPRVMMKGAPSAVVTF